MDEATLYILPTSLVKANFPFVSSFVNEERREKAERYLHEKDQLLSFGAGYLLKKYLPSEDIKESSSGKPYLENGPFFNVSHSGEYVVLAVHPKRDVGVDIERIKENKLDGIRFILNEEEQKVADLETLFLIWSNRESLIKCMGTGIKDIKKISGLPLEGIRFVDKDAYYTKSMIYDGYSLSATLKDKSPFNINIKNIDNI